MEGNNWSLCQFCLTYQRKIQLWRFQGFPEVFLGVDTFPQNELKGPFLTKVIIVVISGNLPTQTLKRPLRVGALHLVYLLHYAC